MVGRTGTEVRTRQSLNAGGLSPLSIALEEKFKVSLNLEVKGDTFWSMWRKDVSVLGKFGIREEEGFLHGFS